MTLGLNCATKELVGAVQRGDLEGIEKALHAGANLHVSFQDDTACPGGTLLCQATARNHVHLIPYLVRAGIPVDDCGAQERAPLHVAAEMGHERALKTLLQHHGNTEVITRDEYMQTPLHRAAWSGEVNCVTELIKAGANKDAKTQNQYTPLHKATRKSHIEIIQILIEAGCDRHACTAAGWTALHVAGLGGCIEAAQVLLSYHLDPTAKDNNGRTPAMVADVWGRNHAQWFFNKLPKVVLDSQPISARVFKDESQVIYEENEKVVLQWAAEGKWWKLKERIPNIRDGHYQDKYGFTALHIAAQCGNLQTVKVLLEDCNAYPGAITRDGQTPMALAQSSGHWQVAQLIQDTMKCPQSVEDEQLYDQLLEIICHSDNVKAASYLLLQGSPFEATGEIPTNAVVLAITTNRPRILTLLLAAGVPLTTISHGLNLLQLAWLSPDVTMFVKMLVTRAVEHVLEHEARQVERYCNELHQGIKNMLNTLQGPHPWLAHWPSPSVSDSCNTKVVPSPWLMVQAAKANCPMTTAFLEEAGVMPYSMDMSTGLSPLTAALKAHHWELAKHLAKTSGSCYILDNTGTLPMDLFPKVRWEKLEKEIYEMESRILIHQREKAKEVKDKNAISYVLCLQKELYQACCRSHNSSQHLSVSATNFDFLQTLLIISQLGLVQLAFFLVKVGVNVNVVVDPITGTTPLHQAAAFGRTPLIAFLLTFNNNNNCIDNCGRFPSHLAAMFGHDQAFEYLSSYFPENPCRVGNTPTMVRNNFIGYLQQYQKLRDQLEINVEPWLANRCSEAIKYHFQFLDLADILRQDKFVSFERDEAAEVRNVVMRELGVIADKIKVINPLFQGRHELVGSAADETRLYAPDEYDVNYVVNLPDLRVEVVNLTKQDALRKAYNLRIEVHADDKDIMKLIENWKSRFYDVLAVVLKDHHIQDHRLSFVPPSLTQTQVGTRLAFSWQGQENRLLQVSIDFVPVIEIPWPKEVNRPFLTPQVGKVYLTSIKNGKWRFTFGGVEASILKQLDIEERRTFLACKSLLSCMKAEPWMPKDVKRRFAWWDSRYWQIPVVCGFALKNSFLRELEHKRKYGEIWAEEDIIKRMKNIFFRMCKPCIDSSTGTEELVPHKVFAYFGGDFEKPKLGIGAPEIVDFLQKNQ